MAAAVSSATTEPSPDFMNLYSRQIGAFGQEAMGKLVKLKVLIVGLDGVGIEVAKNLILAGPESVTLCDDKPLVISDLGSNFCVKEDDIGRPRSTASLPFLAELNTYVSVSVHTGSMTEELVKLHEVAVACGGTKAELEQLNRWCRTNGVGFISANCWGLVSAVFVDFGDVFMVNDEDGNEPRSAIVAGITQEAAGVVLLHSDKPNPFQSGDWVTFREVKGMTQLNESPPRQVKVIDRNSLTIEDTSGYSSYERDGSIVQVKVPKEIKFDSFKKRCTRPVAFGEHGLLMADMAKFGRPEQLHFAIQALLEFEAKHGRLPATRDGQDAQEVFDEALRLNAEAQPTTKDEEMVCVENVDRSIVENVALFARTMLPPLASFIGGIAAQEVVKIIGKFTPIHQWLYFDAFECLPKDPITDWAPRSSRYDDFLAIWGANIQKKLHDQRFFLVGAGALGCEVLKILALLGACSSEGNGLLTITDMDSVEVSNLNRQFLFRRDHVGKLKSATAGNAVLRMNPRFKIAAMNTRVGEETESVFDDKFWDSQNLIINALDNVPSRLYVDGKCVWHGKSLLESGTLGTKANSQVVLPTLTQSYGDSRDPPEESIPLCTLRHFPNQIEHTIEWSRDLFHGLFSDAAQEALTFVRDGPAYLSRLKKEEHPTSQRAQLEKINRLLVVARETADARVDIVVRRSVNLFHDYFYHQISQLLHNFPLDHVTSDGRLFWSAPKRAPTPIVFDANDKLHFRFIKSCANLWLANLGQGPCSDDQVIRDIAAKVTFMPFVPKRVQIKVDESDETLEGAEDDEVESKRLSDICLTLSSGMEGVTFVAAEFEKDDDSNFHLDFVGACANLRAMNYAIPTCDRHKVKMIAGKIIPAIATTTSMITGLVMIEALKLVIHSPPYRLEDFKNSFINLSTSTFILSEPAPPIFTCDKDFDPIANGPVRARPSKFSSWDKEIIDLRGGTLQDLITKIEARFKPCQVMIVSVGVSCLYNSFSAAHRTRLQRDVKELSEQITKAKLPEGRDYLVVEASCTDPTDDVDIAIPTIKLLV